MNQNLDILITEESIRKRVKELGEKISSDYAGREIIAIGILKGAWVFMSDLVREIEIPVICDFIGVSSYVDAAVSSERVKLISDIIDTGFSINFVKGYIKSMNPAGIKVCVLFDKPSRRKLDIHVDYTGFTIPDRFVVGYGLDYAEKYRNLPYIAAIK